MEPEEGVFVNIKDENGTLLHNFDSRAIDGRHVFKSLISKIQKNVYDYYSF